MLRLEIAGVGEVEKGPLGASNAKMGEFLSIRNCDVTDFAGVNEISNNLLRFRVGMVNSPDNLARLRGTRAIWRARRVGAGMGAMFTSIVSIKGGGSAMEDRSASLSFWPIPPARFGCEVFKCQQGR